MEKILQNLGLYLYDNIDTIAEQYGRNRNNIVTLGRKECTRVFESWCAESGPKLDEQSWKYAIKMTENILSSSQDKDTIRLMLKSLLG